MIIDDYSIFLISNFLFFALGYFISILIFNFFRRFFRYLKHREDETFFQILKKSFLKNELLDD